MVHVHLSGGFDVFMAQDSLSVLHCAVLPNVRRKTWNVQSFRGMSRASVMGHTFHLKKFLARKGTALPLFARCPFVGNMRPSSEVSGQAWRQASMQARTRWGMRIRARLLIRRLSVLRVSRT